MASPADFSSTFQGWPCTVSFYGPPTHYGKVRFRVHVPGHNRHSAVTVKGACSAGGSGLVLGRVEGRLTSPATLRADVQRLLRAAPHTTRVGRLDEAGAARRLKVRWTPEEPAGV